MKKALTAINRYLFLALPFVVFFSYAPNFSIASADSMNLEFSVPLIWLLVFGAVSILRTKEIFAHFPLKTLIITSLFPIFASLSILWSPSKLRAVLTAGIIWLLYASILNILSANFNKKTFRKALSIYLTSAACVAGFCVFQCILDVIGVTQKYSLLCSGCTYAAFGFPHPNGFAIEPQFMGNLLILPALLSLKETYNAIISKKGKGDVVKKSLLCFWLIMVLFICYSRGAIVAFMLSVVYFVVALIIKHRSWKPILLGAFCAVALLAGLFAQGMFSKIAPSQIGFREGVARSIHHLSLGKIDFRHKEPTAEKEESATDFDGYIEESTEIRLSLNEAAFTVWKTAPIFGVGLGGSGRAIANELEYYSEKEIVQNEYLAVLLELGICGTVFLIAGLVTILRNYWRLETTGAGVLAFLISLLFFSGLPNALHIYLATPVAGELERKRIL